MKVQNILLNEICTIVDCEHKTAPSQEEGIPLVRTPNIGQGKLILENVKRVSGETYIAWTRRAEPKPGNLIMAREAPVGNVAIIPTGQKVCLGQRTVLIQVTSNDVLPLYLNYVLSSNSMHAYLNMLSNGATVGHLNVTDIRNLKIPTLPIMRVQQKIAAILSSYDDLIENNKRRIDILEKMAEEIYREWFVRFRFPGYQTAEFEKGIPKRWKSKTFREITSYYIGGGWGEEFESPTFAEGAYVIRGTDIPNLAKGDYSTQVYRYHKPSNLKSRKLQKNDFIFEVSGGSKDQLLGRNLMVSEGLLSLFENKVMCASFCKQMRFDAKQVSPLFMKYYLKLYYECDLVGIYQVQSTGISNYQFESFLSYQTITIPDSALRAKFDEIIEPIIKQQEALAFANMNLEKTKASLLPQLISGKLSVEDLDIQFPPSMLEEKSDACR